MRLTNPLLVPYIEEHGEDCIIGAILDKEGIYITKDGEIIDFKPYPPTIVLEDE